MPVHVSPWTLTLGSVQVLEHGLVLIFFQERKWHLLSAKSKEHYLLFSWMDSALQLAALASVNLRAQGLYS